MHGAGICTTWIPHVSPQVSDTAVWVSSMTSRLVTTVTWTDQPPATYDFGVNVTAGALLVQQLVAEGDRCAR